MKKGLYFWATLELGHGCALIIKSCPLTINWFTVAKWWVSLGHAIILEPSDKSPYLRELKVVQHKLETDMYRASVFSHKEPMIDYILVCFAKGKISLTRIVKIYVVS